MFVVQGKLVTLSDEYDGGVGYPFLWKKKMSLRGAARGWSSPEAKENDPRLGIDPSTGNNYVDPKTGVTWVYPGSNSSTKKKRSGDKMSLRQKKKRNSGSPVSGEEAEEPAEKKEEEVFI